jgi:hypothetical protein
MGEMLSANFGAYRRIFGEKMREEACR